MRLCLKGAAMWPVLLFCSSATGLALGLARLKVFALIPATTVWSLTTVVAGVLFGVYWGTTAVAVIGGATILQSSYLIGALLSEAPKPRATPRARLRLDLVRAAQFAIGEELRSQFQISDDMPRQLRTRMNQLLVRYG
jgi:hypothetical protein